MYQTSFKGEYSHGHVNYNANCLLQSEQHLVYLVVINIQNLICTVMKFHCNLEIDQCEKDKNDIILDMVFIS